MNMNDVAAYVIHAAPSNPLVFVRDLKTSKY